jgi:hypothetical protein
MKDQLASTASQRRNGIGANRGWWRSEPVGGLNSRLVDRDEAAALVHSVRQGSARAT